MEEPASDSREALWASDRRRVAVCARVVPRPGVSYENLREEVFARVEWGDRLVRFHDARRAADAECELGWVMECTLSCLAHGDEAQVAYRIASLASDVVEEADVLVSAPCHLPLLEVTTADVAFDAHTGLALSSLRGCLRDENESSNEKNERNGTLRFAADLLSSAGVATCARALDEKDLERCVLAVHRRITRAESALRRNHPSIDLGRDVFAFREMGSRGGNRFDLLFPKPRVENFETERFEGTRGIDATAGSTATEDASRESEDATFIHDLAFRAPWVKTLVEPLFSGEAPPRRDPPSAAPGNASASARRKGYWCDVSVVYSKPGALNQDWHCDGRHLAGAQKADFDGSGVSRPYAVCVFVPLVDLSPEVGFTQFWAGSHRSEGLIGFGAAALVLRGNVDGIIKKGGCVAYDYRTMHRGMGNASKDTLRPVLQFLYATEAYQETKNYGSRSLFDDT